MALKITSFLNKTSIFRPSALNKVFCSSSSSNIPKNEPENEISDGAPRQENGMIFDKKPCKITLKAGKKYTWCCCGRSRKNPFCDGSHAQFIIVECRQRPVRFKVEETKDYWLCMCKQTLNRPFCDGTHRTKAVQEGLALLRQ